VVGLTGLIQHTGKILSTIPFSHHHSSREQHRFKKVPSGQS
jgi:hypothetical protein